MFGQAIIKYDGKEYTFTPTLRDIANFERAGHNVFALASKLSDGVVDAASLSLFVGDCAVLANCPGDADSFYRTICGQCGSDEQDNLRDSLESIFKAVIPENTPKAKKKIQPVTQ